MKWISFFKMGLMLTMIEVGVPILMSKMMVIVTVVVMTLLSYCIFVVITPIHMYLLDNKYVSV